MNVIFRETDFAPVNLPEGVRVGDEIELRCTVRVTSMSQEQINTSSHDGPSSTGGEITTRVVVTKADVL